MSSITHFPLRSLAHFPKRLCFGLSTALLLSGCGGGGSGDDASTTPRSYSTAAAVTLDVTSSGASGGASFDVAASRLPAATSCDNVPAVPTLPANSIRVTDFGAVPNDGIDDTSAIQAALNAAKTGQWVVFPAGQYIQSRSLLVLRSGVTLWGSGATLHATNPTDQSVMLKADGIRMYGFRLTAVTEGRGTKPEHARIAAYGSEAVDGYISGIVIQGNSIVPASSVSGTSLSNSATAAGILLVSARDFTVAQNRVERSLADGIHMTGRSQNGRVIGNVVRETGDDTIAVVSYLNKTWRTQMEESPDWLTTTALPSRVHDILIQDNDVDGQYWGRGIAIIGGSNITINRNKINRSTLAAGILVARERSYGTHGVSNVLVENNTVTAVQTEAPTYMPSGEYFSSLEQKTAANGGRTGQAGIEIHNTTSSADASSDVLRPAVMVAQIMVRNNTISDVARQAIRVGADSQPGTILDVGIVDNAMEKARTSPMSANYSTGALVSMYCSGNTYEGSPTTLPSCTSAPIAAASNWGSTLDCASF